ncbi:MmcQ/YjbR family DNA-binding protein [Pseudomonas sp. 5P_5.1_Bac1]|uniref:MmcQ/YjbR family DNA-binding protein n=1 Tax=Pseudomonas sp. 5P_5.1_Bac1 TaxID=2971616 RepID=UPI0021C78BC3|nr:MmcQ/YjbR family DNA-binding protein [Pseudomonas sp. 5P_5.1_Bac1]MCU1719734.1 MmcQ/YjbR family DNA-binding protein [Pseudomonas sp. 5P_5.1_Bac1]
MSEKTLNQEQVAEFCLTLPGAREDYKWGGVRVFSVAGNKMFAVLDLAGAGLSFKVDKDLFLGYVDIPGVRPAPYLARAHWISVAPPYALGRETLEDMLRRSHQLVVKKLPKRLQVGLLLD